jgi:hypothetical protein
MSYDEEARVLRNRRWGILVAGAAATLLAGLATLKDLDERLEAFAFAKGSLRRHLCAIDDRVDRLEAQLRAARISGVDEGQADADGPQDERCAPRDAEFTTRGQRT